MSEAEATERAVSGGSQRGRTQTVGAASLVSDQGRTTIADGVVAKIAGIAAREIEGVHRLVSTGSGAAFSSFTQRVSGDTRSQGVTVEVGEREAAVDLGLVVVYGASVAQVAQAVRQNIISRVREMTGLIVREVREVNIVVTDLYFPGEEQAPEQAQ
jgi:uncharacterized alkaline shock family protein YloU